MAPPFVLDYLAAHEVAHLRELNHSPRFWNICHALAPETRLGARAGSPQRPGAARHRRGIRSSRRTGARRTRASEAASTHRRRRPAAVRQTSPPPRSDPRSDRSAVAAKAGSARRLRRAKRLPSAVYAGARRLQARSCPDRGSGSAAAGRRRRRRRAPSVMKRFQALAGRLLPRRFLGRLVVVVAEPDAGGERAGVADEPGVAEILRRCRSCRPPASRRSAPCARCRWPASP